MKELLGLLAAAATMQAQLGGFGSGIGGGGGRGGVNVQANFQQAGTLVAAGGGGLYQFSEASRIAVVVGRPFSATEERRSVQTLGDGTEISNSNSTLIYRDSQGRTRTEPDAANEVLAAVGVKTAAAIQITDPVSKFTITLNPISKVARRMAMPERTDFTSSTMPAGTVVRAARGGRGASNNITEEDLGPHSLNGVVATGRRSTLTIPQGTIGNNRDIHVVNERWYSDDLQMLVKTVNSDPRFGEDTYELTSISRDEPDPSLFQIPAGYTVLDGGGRGGRGGEVQPAITIPRK